MVSGSAVVETSPSILPPSQAEASQGGEHALATRVSSSHLHTRRVDIQHQIFRTTSVFGESKSSL